jgi:hypothetical protein
MIQTFAKGFDYEKTLSLFRGGAVCMFMQSIHCRREINRNPANRVSDLQIQKFQLLIVTGKQRKSFFIVKSFCKSLNH